MESVRGGRLYRFVEKDLLLAEQALSAEGIVAVDDFSTSAGRM
jgi:hypothetical protein